MVEIDNIDRKIIQSLQSDASQSVAALGEMVGLSQNACWHRIRRMRESGLLKSQVAVFDPHMLGYTLTVFAILKVREHSDSWTEKFAKAMTAIPEVIEFYRMSGEIDYIAKIYARDIQHYDLIYKKIIAIGDILDVSSSFSMETIKSGNRVPV